MVWHQAGLRVIAFHLGVQPNGEEIERYEAFGVTEFWDRVHNGVCR
jgi:hypothetical protein